MAAPDDHHPPLQTLDAMLGAADTADPSDEETQRYASLERMLRGADGLDPSEPTERARYQVERVLGRGGVGEVLLVHDDVLEREVAVKTLQVDSAKARRAFWHEARVTATLEHPAIMPVYDAGTLGAKGPYFAMKRVVGRDLFQLVRDGEAPPLRRRVEVFLRACEAVAYAHDRGWLHRDLKPDNIMVGPYGEVLVADWGLAWSLDDAHPPRRAGTPQYMPPEQLEGARLTPAADVYALGGTLWFLLTGEVPLEGESLDAVLVRLRAGRGFVPPAGRLPPELHAIVAHALAPGPEGRYPGVPALQADVQAWLDGREVRAHTYSARERALRWADRHGRRVVAGALVVALGSGVVAAAGLITGGVIWRSLVVTRAAQQASAQAEAKARQAEAATRSALRASLVAQAASAMALGDVGAAQEALHEARDGSGDPLVEAAAIDVFGGGVPPVHRFAVEGRPVDVALQGEVLAILSERMWVRRSLADGTELARGALPKVAVAWLPDGSVLARAPGRWLQLDPQGAVLAEAPGPAEGQSVRVAGTSAGELWVQSYDIQGGGRLWRLGPGLSERPVPEALAEGFLFRVADDGTGIWAARRAADMTRGGFRVELATGARRHAVPTMQVAWSEAGWLYDGGGEVCAAGEGEAALCATGAPPYRFAAAGDRLFVAGEGGQVTARAATDARPRHRFDGSVGRPVALVTDGRWLVHLGEEATVWGVPDVAVDPAWQERAGAVMPHPGGRLLALATAAGVVVFDGPTGLRVAQGPEHSGRSVAWSAAGDAFWHAGRAEGLRVPLDGGNPVAFDGGLVASMGEGAVVHDPRVGVVRWVASDGRVTREVPLGDSFWSSSPGPHGSIVWGANARSGDLLGVRVTPEGTIERWGGARPELVGFGAWAMGGGRIGFPQQDGALIVREADGGLVTWAWQNEPLLGVVPVPLDPGQAYAAVDFTGRLHLLAGPDDAYTVPVADTLRGLAVAGDTLWATGPDGVHRRRLHPWPADTVQGRLVQGGAFRRAAALGPLADRDRVSLALVTGEGLDAALGDRHDPEAQLLRRYAQEGAPVRLGDAGSLGAPQP